jgi:site-specific recombinase XerD
MAIPINSEYNIDEICSTFGIEKEDFLNLIEGKQAEPKSSRTIVEAIDEFMCSVNKSSRSLNTITYYSSFLTRFKAFVQETDPSLDILQLTSDLLNDFHIERCHPREGNRLSNGSINTYQSIVRELLLFSLVKQYITIDLRSRFETFGTELLPRYVPNDIAEKLVIQSLYTSRPHLNKALLIFLLGSGCRLSEVIKLKVNQFDIENEVIFIKRSKGYKDRYVPIYPEVKDVLLDFLKKTGIETWDRSNEAPLFTKGYGADRPALSFKYLQRIVKSILRNIGADNKYSVHSFRHTFAVNCLVAGMRIEILAQVMGHKSIETTRIYTKLHLPELKQQVTSKYPFPFEKLMQLILPTRG